MRTDVNSSMIRDTRDSFRSFATPRFIVVSLLFLTICGWPLQGWAANSPETARSLAETAKRLDEALDHGPGMVRFGRATAVKVPVPPRAHVEFASMIVLWLLTCYFAHAALTRKVKPKIRSLRRIVFQILATALTSLVGLILICFVFAGDLEWESLRLRRFGPDGEFRETTYFRCVSFKPGRAVFDPGQRYDSLFQIEDAEPREIPESNDRYVLDSTPFFSPIQLLAESAGRGKFPTGMVTLDSNEGIIKIDVKHCDRDADVRHIIRFTHPGTIQSTYLDYDAYVRSFSDGTPDFVPWTKFEYFSIISGMPTFEHKSNPAFSRDVYIFLSEALKPWYPKVDWEATLIILRSPKAISKRQWIVDLVPLAFRHLGALKRELSLHPVALKRNGDEKVAAETEGDLVPFTVNGGETVVAALASERVMDDREWSIDAVNLTVTVAWRPTVATLNEPDSLAISWRKGSRGTWTPLNEFHYQPASTMNRVDILSEIRLRRKNDGAAPIVFKKTLEIVDRQWPSDEPPLEMRFDARGKGPVARISLDATMTVTVRQPKKGAKY